MCNENRMNMIKKLIVYKNIDVQTLISSKLDTECINVLSKFYRQILDIWYHFYSKKPKSVNDTVNTSIFYNKMFVIDCKPVFYKQWFDAGIQLFGDILDANGHLLSKVNLEQKYNLEIKQMDYNLFIHCVPKEMLDIVKNKRYKLSLDSTVYLMINNKNVPLEKLKCRDVYWEYIREISEIPKAERKWAEYLHLENILWEDYYYIPFNSCRETHIQTFQYKIFHRFFPCKYTLSLWYKDKDPYCTYCNGESIDILEHYFYLCPEVYAFWQSLMTWLSNSFEISITLDVISVIFGIANPDYDHVINFMNVCILYAKWYMYTCKYKEEPLFFFTYVKMFEKCVTN